MTTQTRCFNFRKKNGVRRRELRAGDCVTVKNVDADYLHGVEVYFSDSSRERLILTDKIGRYCDDKLVFQGLRAAEHATMLLTMLSIGSGLGYKKSPVPEGNNHSMVFELIV